MPHCLFRGSQKIPGMAYQLTLSGNLSMLELHVLAHPALWFVKTSWPSSIHTIQKAVCPVLHIPKLHGLLGDSPFSVCSGHGNCQIQENREPDTRSTTCSPFSRKNNCKGKHPLLHSQRTTGKNGHSQEMSEVRTCQVVKDMS